MVKAYVGTNHRKWDENITHFGFTINSVGHETTTYTPAYLNVGRELQVNFTVTKHDTASDEEVPEIVANDRYESKLEDFLKVRKKLDLANQENTTRCNLRRWGVQFKVNDLVWKKNFQQSDAANYFSSKLSPHVVRPYIVIQKVTLIVIFTLWKGVFVIFSFDPHWK